MKPEKIYFKDIRGKYDHAYISHVILNALGGKNGENVANKSKGTYDKITNEDSRYLEVELKINGVQLEFKPFIESIESQIDRMIESTAKKMVLTKLDKFNVKIRAIEKAMVRTVGEQLGVKIKEEDYW